MKRCSIIAVAAVVVLGARSTPAATIAVPGDQPTIQAGVNAAQNGDTVLVSPGTYNEDVTIIGKDIVLLGDTTSYSVILEPSGPGLVPLTIQDCPWLTTQVVGFVVQNAEDVRGILCIESSPTIRKNHVRDNSGGGIALIGTGLGLIEDNFIYRNQAVDGAGVLMDEAGADVLRNMIDSNRAGELGGGLLTDNRATLAAKDYGATMSTYVIADNLFRGNFAGLGGGGVFLYEGFPILIEGNLFVRDTSDHGGGLDNSGRDDAVVVGNTFDRCIAGLGTGGGNAIWWAAHADVGGVVKNNILSNTTTGGYSIGGALGGDETVVDVQLDYNCYWNNWPADLYGFTPGPNALMADPMYCSPLFGDYTLHVSSPCVGSGEGGSDRGAFGVGCSGALVTNIDVGEEADAYHLLDHQPLCSWSYFDPTGQPLSMSEVEVGTDEDWTVAEMWQPPAIPAPDMSVVYNGEPLIDGASYYIRIRVHNGIEWSFWAGSGFRMNSVPSSPEPYAPDDGSVVETPTPSVRVFNAEDAENDVLTYGFEVYSDGALTELVAAAEGVSSVFSVAFWYVDPPLTNENEMYWWRSRAWDGFEDGPWCATQTFWLDTINEPPQPFALLVPSDESVVHSIAALFDWEDAVDHDPAWGIASYTLYLATDSDFNFAIQYAGLPLSNYISDPVLSPGQRYWWKVQAIDKQGSMSESPVWTFQPAIPGDLNNDGSYTIEDVVALVNVLFRGGQQPDGLLAIDVNGDCALDVLDIVFLITHVFRDGPAPGSYCTDMPLSGETLRVPDDFPTIQEAVDAAFHGDTVLVAPGTYTENVLVLNKYVVLLGDTVSYGVILEPDGIGSSPISFRDVSRTTELVGFVVQNAAAAGVFCSEASPTIRRNHIRDNQDGGIVLTGPGLALIADNFIYRNEAYAGAGILMDESGADVFRNVIDSNRAFVGGGILSDNRIAIAAKMDGDVEPTYVIADNILRGNFAASGGGGIYLYEGFPIAITGNLFVHDTSSFGGGLDNSGRDDAMVIGNTFDACVAGIADGAGNAIWWAGHADLGGVIKNNIVTNTISTTWWGGAIGGDDAIIGKVTVDYNAFWNNQLGSFYGFSPGLHSLEADPLYCDPAAENYYLDAASPCVGTGEGGVDRGAFGVGCGIK